MQAAAEVASLRQENARTRASAYSTTLNVTKQLNEQASWHGQAVKKCGLSALLFFFYNR